MKIAVQKLNQDGIVLKRGLLDKALLKYTSLFSKSCYKLYDLGYQLSPSEFNIAEFRKAYNEDFPSMRDEFNSFIDDCPVYTYQVADYLKLKYRNDEHYSCVVSCLSDVLRAQDAIEALNKTYDKVNLKKKSETLIKPRLSVSNTIADYSTIPLDNFAVLECFERKENTYLRYIDTRDIVVKHLCIEVGVPIAEYEKHKLLCDAFFVSGLSAKEELNFISLISDGTIHLDGKFGKLLEDKITDYYRTNSETLNSRFSCSKFEETIFVKSLEERFEITKEKRNELTPIGGKEFYVTKDYIIFEVPNMVNKRKESYFGDGIITGNYVMDYISETELDKCNNLMGVSGEYISKKDVELKGYATLGRPIKLIHLIKSPDNSLRSIDKEYFHISQVLYSEERNSRGELIFGTLIPHIGKKYAMSFSDISAVFLENGVSSKEELFRSLKSSVVTTFELACGKDSYSGLVADLTCALVYMDCGYPDYKLVNNNYEFVTDDIFYKACYDANLLFKQVII